MSNVIIDNIAENNKKFITDYIQSLKKDKTLNFEQQKILISELEQMSSCYPVCMNEIISIAKTIDFDAIQNLITRRKVFKI